MNEDEKIRKSINKRRRRKIKLIFYPMKHFFSHLTIIKSVNHTNKLLDLYIFRKEKQICFSFIWYSNSLIKNSLNQLSKSIKREKMYRQKKKEVVLWREKNCIYSNMLVPLFLCVIMSILSFSILEYRNILILNRKKINILDKHANSL